MKKLVVITGATASGKTALGVALARELNGEIISADSRQVYKEMDIGTGKDLSEYIEGGKPVPYHLIDIKPVGYKYNVSEFVKDFDVAYNQIQSNHHLPILCGGTGMYIEATLKGFFNDLNIPVNQSLRDTLEAYNQEQLLLYLDKLGRPSYFTDVNHRKRLIRAIEVATWLKENNKSVERWSEAREFEHITLAIRYEREERRERITKRLHSRIKEGMIDEVEYLLTKVSADDLVFYGLEYKFVTQYLLGQLSYDEMLYKLEVSIHQFAKRQMTWFRRMERQGEDIHWIEGNSSFEEKKAFSLNILRNFITKQ